LEDRPDETLFCLTIPIPGGAPHPALPLFALQDIESLKELRDRIRLYEYPLPPLKVI
jgi:hypothetical protein